jgi:hypothetical protein
MKKRQHNELIADSNRSTEEGWVLREAKDITMNQFPTRLLLTKRMKAK